MRSGVRAIVFIFILFASLNAGAEPESILEHASDIVVHQDGSITVTEKITVVALGIKIKRGIYRSFPIEYKDKRGNNYRVDFEVEEVLKNGIPEEYHIKTEDGFRKVYIGSSDVFLKNGIYEYTIRYKTNRQIGFFEKYDELYWNVTGNGWEFAIEKASTTIHLPAGSKIIQHASYSGSPGASMCRGCNTEIIDDETIRFSTTQKLQERQGLTVAVAWPKGLVREPSAIEKAKYFLIDNLAILFGLLGLIIVFLYYLYAWIQVGKDPEKGPIIPLFGPPLNFTPAAVRFVYKMGFDNKTFTASIVNMAVKNHIKIIQGEEGTYVLEKQSGSLDKLSAAEKVVSDKLFRGGSIIEMENENHVIISTAKDGLKRKLKEEFEKAHFNLNYKWLAKGIIFSVVVIAGMIWLSVNTTQVPIFQVVIAAGFIITNAVFFYLIKAPTLYGRKVMDQIEGLKMYLSVADQDRLNKLNPPDRTPELFEKLLPYAIALNVENEWGEQFNDILKKAAEEGYQPTWYGGYQPFVYSGFSRQIGSSFASAVSASSVAPGSSSGSSGGGSSGGGGGGGGGGGW